MRADCLPVACVTVRVGGENAVEYGLENDATKATAFIEAIPGANFAITLDIGKGYPYHKGRESIKFKILIDGQAVRSQIVNPHHDKATQATVDGKVDSVMGVSMLREFQFAEHDSTEDVATIPVLQRLVKLGEIQVGLYWCHKIGSCAHGSPSSFQDIGKDPVPEKALKGRSISSHTTLGPGRKVLRSEHVSVTYPYGKVPIATYIFRYRTRRDLEIEGIVERPVPLEERDPEHLTPDQLREQVRLLRAAADKVKIKQELKREKRARSVTLDIDDNDDDVTITGVSDRRKRAKASAESIEVLDLTED